MTLYLRLLPEVDDELRSRLRRRGDLSRIVDSALRDINLKSVRLINDTPERLRQLLATVTRQSDDRVREIANQRQCTVSALANSAIARWLAKNEGRV